MAAPSNYVAPGDFEAIAITVSTAARDYVAPAEIIVHDAGTGAGATVVPQVSMFG